MMTPKASWDRSAKASRSVLAAAQRARSFTLVELLVALTVILIIAGITVLGVRAVAREAKLSSATNTVVAALDTGRAHAIRSGNPTLVAFRPTLVSPRDSRIEIVTAEWAGDTRVVDLTVVGIEILDRMRPVPGLATRTLPSGIMVAGPLYFRQNPSFEDLDEVWLVPSDLARVGPEPPGRVIGVLFAPDGTVRLRMPERESSMFWIDMNGDGIQTIYPEDTNDVDEFFNMIAPDEETNIEPVRFLAVFDYEQARDEVVPAPDEWQDWEQRGDALTDFINENADRLHFNRYTGVVMR